MRFDCLDPHITGLGGWRCVSTALGAPSVMASGTTEMPVWCADNWDTPLMVCFFVVLIIKVLLTEGSAVDQNKLTAFVAIVLTYNAYYRTL